MAADPPPAAPGPLPARPPEGMVALGAQLGALTWWCEQTFATVGAWVPDVGEATVRVHLAEVARVLADAALGLRGHLPRPGGLDPSVWVRPPSPAAEAVVGALDAPGTSVERLGGLHRSLLPRLGARAATIAGGEVDLDRRALARTLGHLGADLRTLGCDGEALLDALVLDGPSAESLGGRVAALERAWAEAGGAAASAPPPEL